MTLCHILDQPGQRIEIGDVERMDLDTAAFRFDGGFRLREFLCAAGTNHHHGAAPREQLRGRETDAVAAAGDDRHPAFETSAHLPMLQLLSC